VKNPKITDKELHIAKRNLPHWQLGGSWYFVTFRTRGIELDSNSRDVVSDCILYPHGVMYKLAIAIIMSDHVHLLFRPIAKDKENYFSLTEIIQPIKAFPLIK